MQQVTIYTDGACKGNPGKGGWGAILIYGELRKEIYGGNKLTTNNQMELQAVIEALKLLKKPCQVLLYSDSTYVVKGAEQWLMNWRKNDWRVAKKKKIKNLDLWRQLALLIDHHQISWFWVKGHSNHPENDRADYLANKGVENI